MEIANLYWVLGKVFMMSGRQVKSGEMGERERERQRHGVGGRVNENRYVKSGERTF